MPNWVKRDEKIYEIITTETGTHINIYTDEIWERKVFVSSSEYRTSET